MDLDSTVAGSVLQLLALKDQRSVVICEGGEEVEEVGGVGFEETLDRIPDWAPLKLLEGP